MSETKPPDEIWLRFRPYDYPVVTFEEAQLSEKYLLATPERETARELLEALEAVNALTMDHFNLRPIAGRRMSNADQDLIDKTFDLVEAAIARADEFEAYMTDARKQARKKSRSAGRDFFGRFNP